MLETLPDIGLAAVALFLILLATALWVVERMVKGSLGRAPVIGGWVNREIGGWLNDARNATLHAAGSAWDAAKRLFNWMGTLIWTIFAHTVDFATNTADTLVHLAEVTLPTLLVRAEADIAVARTAADAYTRAVYHVLTGYVSSAAGRLRADLDQAVAVANRDIAAARTAAEDFTLAAVGEAEKYTAAGLRTIEEWARTGLADAGHAIVTEAERITASVTAAEQRIAADIGISQTAAEAYAAAVAGAVRKGIYTDLEAWGNQALRISWPDAAGDLRALRDAAGADFPWLSDAVKAMGGLGVTGLAGALIRAMATSQAATRALTDCVLPSCRNLSGLSQLLAGLENLIAGDLIFTLLTELAADPGRAARDIEDTLTRPVDDAVKLVTALLGA